MCLAVLSGCATPQALPSPIDPLNPGLDYLVASALQRPSIPGEIRSILEEALEEGELTFGSYTAAANLFVDCAADAGLAVTLVPGMSQGVAAYGTTITYPIGVEAETDEEVALTRMGDECARVWLEPVEHVYMAQPVAWEARDRSLGPYVDDLRSCLAEHGGDIEGIEGFVEFMNLNQQVSQDAGFDCMLEVGYYGG